MNAMVDIEWLLLPTTLGQIMIAMAVITFINLLVGPTAPYGRSGFLYNIIILFIQHVAEMQLR